MKDVLRRRCEMEWLELIGRNAAHILKLLVPLVCCILLGCGGGSQANTASAPKTPASSSSSLHPSTVAHSVHLKWAPSPSVDVLGYNVYRATQSGGPYAKLNPALEANPDYLDSTVTSGQTYYYSVTAVSAIAESARSAEVVAVIPTP